jgi:hypothetical protein
MVEWLDWLDDNLPGRWIGRRGAIDWPARSPDLTPCDFSLWGIMKNMVYSEPCDSVDALKNIIIACFDELANSDAVQSACDTVFRRCQLCLDANGHPFEYLS